MKFSQEIASFNHKILFYHTHTPDQKLCFLSLSTFVFSRNVKFFLGILLDFICDEWPNNTHYIDIHEQPNRKINK